MRVQSSQRHAMYWHANGHTHRLPRPAKDLGEGSFQRELDLRGRRIAFVNQYEWGADLDLTTIGGRRRLLVRMPGSGAETFDLTAQGPTVGRRVAHWALSIGEDAPVYSEIREVSLTTLKEKRATGRITAPDTVNRATAGFAQDRGTSWYVRVPAPDEFEIHRATGLRFQSAPPPRAPR